MSKISFIRATRVYKPHKCFQVTKYTQNTKWRYATKTFTEIFLNESIKAAI